jgi:hypothetical protein
LEIEASFRPADDGPRDVMLLRCGSSSMDELERLRDGVAGHEPS